MSLKNDLEQIERDKDGNVTSFRVLELELMEVSVVGIPMNAQASIFEVVEKSFQPLKGNKAMPKTQVELDVEKAAAAVSTSALTAAAQNLADKTDKDKVDDAGSKLNEHIKAHKAEHVQLEKEWSEQHNGFHKEFKEYTEKCNKALDSLGEQIKSLKGKKDGDTAVTTPVTPPVEPAKPQTFEEKMLAFMQKQEEFNGKIEAELKAPTRKGASQVDEEPEVNNEVVVETPKKVLKSVDDVETVTFVKACMNDMDLYNTLSVEEKKIADRVYYVLLNRKACKKG